MLAVIIFEATFIERHTMARGRVAGKSKAVEEASKDASKDVSAGPPSKKTKSNEEATTAAVRKLVKITIEHCTS